MASRTPGSLSPSSKSQPGPAEVRRLRPRATGHLRDRKAVTPYTGSAPLLHLHRPQDHHLRLPAEAVQMLTAAIQSSRPCPLLHDRHISGQDSVVSDALSRVESVSASPSDDALAASQDGVSHRPASRETVRPCYHGLHLLRHVFRENLTVRSSSYTAPSVLVRPGSVAPRHQSNGGAGRTAFCVARRGV
jgi:hypothetical protein